MTRLEKLRQDIMESDEKAMVAMLEYILDADRILNEHNEACRDCEYFMDGDCYNFYPEPDFVCPRPTTKEFLREYLNEEP